MKDSRKNSGQSIFTATEDISKSYALKSSEFGFPVGVFDLRWIVKGA